MLTHPDIALAIAHDRARVLLDQAANDLIAAQLPCGSEPTRHVNWTALLARFGFEKPCLEPSLS
jgi:hypothetical protein